MSISDGK